MHKHSGEDKYTVPLEEPLQTYLADRYSKAFYEGILIVTSASTFSIIGNEQFFALKNLSPSLSPNEQDTGEATIRFGPGELTK